LAGLRCWDRAVEATFRATGEARVDAALQNREELLTLCEFIARYRVRSYLEIGVWTGRLVSALHAVFDFDTVAVCDQRWAEQLGLPIAVPVDAHTYWGDSDEAGYVEWRRRLPPIDLVLIDGDHRYRGVRRDFEINRALPHRFLAFHDISGFHSATRGVARLWGELEGSKLEICRPHRELGLSVTTMGIGIWSETEEL